MAESVDKGMRVLTLHLSVLLTEGRDMLCPDHRYVVVC